MSDKSNKNKKLQSESVYKLYNVRVQPDRKHFRVNLYNEHCVYEPDTIDYELCDSVWASELLPYQGRSANIPEYNSEGLPLGILWGHNILGNLSGVICDGAKASCAMKISSGIYSAFDATMLALNKDVLKSGDGIVGVDIEETIRNVGELAQSGMKGTDETILDIKHTVGTAIAPLEDAEYAFQGRDMMNGLGRRCVIHQSEVYQVINDCIAGLLDEVKQMIRSAAPEIVADIMQHGIWLTGGTARLAGLADRIGTELGVPVHVPEAPETKVVVGLNGASSDLVSLSRFIVNSKNRKGRD